VRTNGESQPQALVAQFGSNDRLEIAINNGNATYCPQAEIGTEVTLTWIL
jgi:S-adenosylmethionine hydrolase